MTSIKALLLGPPPPVISSSAMEKRLSKHEQRIITAAFHHARGYEEHLTFTRFRDTVLQESFQIMPRGLMERVFAVWNYSGSGTLSLREFLVGVAIAWKGTRDEHLRFVFQLLDRNGKEELVRDDLRAILPMFAQPDGVVATSSDGNERYTIEDMLKQLFTTEKTVITPSRFVRQFKDRRFQPCGLVDWISAMARPYQQMAGQDTHEVSHRVSLLLRWRSSSGGSTSSTIDSSAVASPSSTQSISEEHTLVHESEISALIKVEMIPPDRFQTLKTSWNRMLDQMDVPLRDGEIMLRLCGLISNEAVCAITHTLRCCQRDVSSLPSDMNPSDQSESNTLMARWTLALCCSFARSSSEVLRYLFVLLDEQCLGYWAVDELGKFKRLLPSEGIGNPNDNESTSWAQSALKALSQSSSPPPSPSGRENSTSRTHPRMYFRDFEIFIRRQHIRGFSPTEIDTLFVIFHIQRIRVQRENLLHDAWMMAMTRYCEQLLTADKRMEHGLCVVEEFTWQRLIDYVCEYEEDSPLTQVLRHQMGKRVRISRREAVIVPLALWIMITARLDDDSECNDWIADVTVLKQRNATENDNGEENFFFRGMMANLEAVFVAADGMERRFSLPHLLIHESLSVRDTLEAVSSLQGLRSDSTTLANTSKTLFCDGTMRISMYDPTVTLNDAIQLPNELADSPLKSLVDVEHVRTVRLQLNVLEADARHGSRPLEVASSEHFTLKTPRHASIGWSKVHGLTNLGNTCFMNSSLQCLAMTPVLREYFLKGEHLLDLHGRTESSPIPSHHRSRKPSSDVADESRSLPSSSLLPLAFARLLKEMSTYASTTTMPTVLDAVTPSDLKQAVAAQFPHLSDGSQQDAQEFLSSLLSCLSEELKRSPIHREDVGDADLLSPSVFARFASFSRSSELTSSSAASQDVAVTINDSDGRPDMVVAKEWWIAHLLREPSIITALFCGQFKSVLRCSHCGNSSTRFEPFSSLQLPLVDETAMLSPRKKPQRTDVVVVLHFLGHQTPHRLVVTSGLDWTIEQLLIKLQETHATFSSAGHRRDHVAVQLNGACIDAVLDPDALLVTLPTPINVFELEYQTLAYQTSSPKPFVVNEGVLLQETPERWIRAVITRVDDSHGNCAPRSPVGSQSPPPLRYHVHMNENVHRRQVIVYGQELRPITDDRFLFLRFVHRHRGLVPFYATSPFRPVLVGVPFIHRIPASKATGKALYRAIHYRLSRYLEGSKWSQRAFVLRRVSCDGKCCDRCHWTTNCAGCPIDRSDESSLDLEIDETIAIDWAESDLIGISSPGDNEDDWWAMMTEVEDDPSYTAYRESQTQGLTKSLKMLCAEEKLEARCSRCETQDTHSETAESTDQRQDTPRGFQIHTKSLTLWSLPAILVIQLKRFELVDDGGFSWQRLNHSIDFPIDELDLSPFLAESEASQDSGRDAAQVTKAETFLKARLQFPTDTASRDLTTYRLYGIVHHMGDLGGGHYTAHVRHPESGDWWLVDDATVTPARVDHLSPSSSAYLLFYVRDDVDSCMEGTLLSPRHQIPTEWYPPQHGATRVSDHVIEQLWNQLKTPAMSSKPSGQPDENKCVMM